MINFKKVRPILILVSTLFSVFYSCGQEALTNLTNETVLEVIKKDRLPSLSLAIMKEGKLVYEQAFGYSDLENKVEATPKSVYRIGSISKSITTVVTMALKEKGVLDIDTNIKKYCPEFPEKEFPITIKFKPPRRYS